MSPLQDPSGSVLPWLLSWLLLAISLWCLHRGGTPPSTTAPSSTRVSRWLGSAPGCQGPRACNDGSLCIPSDCSGCHHLLLCVVSATGTVGLPPVAPGHKGAHGVVHLPGDCLCLWLLTLCLHPHSGECGLALGTGGSCMAHPVWSTAILVTLGPMAYPSGVAAVALWSTGSGPVSCWAGVHTVACCPRGYKAGGYSTAVRCSAASRSLGARL